MGFIIYDRLKHRYLKMMKILLLNDFLQNFSPLLHLGSTDVVSPL